MKCGRMGTRHFMAAALVCLFGPNAWGGNVGLAGILGSKALLVIDGGEPRAVTLGQSLDGVKVLQIQGDQVLVEIDGRKRVLRVGQNAMGVADAEGQGKHVLTADGQGQFFTTGTINGVSIRFLVDTGASAVALGAADARRLGIDPGRGERMLSTTANGVVEVTRVKLDTVKVGNIVLHNVDGLIHRSELPFALLGMSLLNRVELQRDGGTMTLKKRF